VCVYVQCGNGDAQTCYLQGWWVGHKLREVPSVGFFWPALCCLIGGNLFSVAKWIDTGEPVSFIHILKFAKPC
jgi:hypothetical protein